MDYTKTITTSAGDVVVRKLRVKDYAEVLRALKQIPVKIGELTAEKEKLSNQKILEIAPLLIADCLPEVCEIFSKASDKEPVFFEEIHLDELVEIFGALYELNDFNKIAGTVKKVFARQSENS